MYGVFFGMLKSDACVMLFMMLLHLLSVLVLSICKSAFLVNKAPAFLNIVCIDWIYACVIFRICDTYWEVITT